MAAWVPQAPSVGDPLATKNFESLRKYLALVDGSLALINLGLAARPVSVRGSVNVGFTASQFSAAATVTHGLGSTPAAVLLTSDSTAGAFCVVTHRNIGATTFQILGWSPGLAITASIPVSWQAIA